MDLPKLQIEINPLEYEQSILLRFIRNNNSNNIPYYIYKKYPTLEKLNDSEFKEEVKRIYNKKQKEFNKKKQIFKKELTKIETTFLKELSSVLEINWPKNKTITVFISLNPINPRFLQYWQTNIYYKKNKSSFKKTLAHEIIHFLYFEKWKEVFPKYNTEEFDSPHMIWQLSEILVCPILNDPRIRKSLGYKSNRLIGSKGYLMHKTFKVDYNNKQISIVEYFIKLYNKHIVKEKMQFDKFLQLSNTKFEKYIPELKNNKMLI